MRSLLCCLIFCAAFGPAFASEDEVLAVKGLWDRKSPDLLSKQELAAKEWKKKSAKKAQALESVRKETKGLSPLFEAYQKAPDAKSKGALTAGITRFCEAVGRLHKTQGRSADETY